MENSNASSQGKLTADDVLSCSRVAAYLGFSKWSTPNNELAKTFAFIDGRPREFDQMSSASSLAIKAGHFNEPFILQEGTLRLGLPADALEGEITEPVSCDIAPLQGSLDGIIHGDGRVIRTDPANNIYVIGADEITLDGPGVAEAKLTQVRPTERPDPARGALQCQGLMACTGYKWSALFVYRPTTDFFVYLLAPEAVMQAKILADAWDFNDRVEHYRSLEDRSKFRQWLAPMDNEECAQFYPQSDDSEPPLELTGENARSALALWEIIETRKKLEKSEALAQIHMKQVMGCHKRAVVLSFWGDITNTDEPYLGKPLDKPMTLEWGDQAARPASVINRSASEAKRRKSIIVRSGPVAQEPG